MKVTLLNSLGRSSEHQKLNLYASHVAWSGVDRCGGFVGAVAVVKCTACIALQFASCSCNVGQCSSLMLGRHSPPPLLSKFWWQV